MMSEYSEPWEVTCEGGFVFVKNAENDFILDNMNEEFYPDGELIKRISVCVNACRGIPTEFLQRDCANEYFSKLFNGLPEADAFNA